MKRSLLTFAFFIGSAGWAWGILPGPIKDFYTPQPGDTTAIVFGTRNVSAEWLRKLERLAYRNADYLKQKDPSRVVQVYADSAFPKELFPRRSLVLMGTPKSNAVLAEWRTVFPFMLQDRRFNISGRKVYFGEDLTLVCIFPNPQAEDRYVLLLTGSEPEAQPSLSDWPGDYDYYVAQKYTFFGRYLNRGKFQKTTSTWSQELTEYDRAPVDTTDVVGWVYPYGKVWYPYEWELDSLWDNPFAERVRLLNGIGDLTAVLERELGLRISGSIDFELSDRYPEASAQDPMGRVFIRTHPKQIDSLAILSWGKPLVRVLFAGSDAGLDWELFGHRYLLTQNFFRFRGKLPADVGSLSAGKVWAEAFTAGDSTYFTLLTQFVHRGQAAKIGEALDSVTEGGRKFSFKMRDFAAVLSRLVKDPLLQQLAKLPLRPSPYGQKAAYDLGILNLGETFLNRQVTVEGFAPKSRAFAAGLRKGDNIVSVDGQPTGQNRSRAYLAWLGKKKGESIKLVVERKGGRRTLVIPVG